MGYPDVSGMEGVGLVGLCLDIVKAPGYVWGAILELMGRSIRKSPLKS